MVDCVRRFMADLPRPDLDALTAMFAADHMLPRTACGDLDEKLGHIAGLLTRTSVQFVYTAFDGDQFELTPQMRSWVFAQGWIPANPENIVGYKDSVDAHKNKSGVLLDDLAIVGQCDRLCVFTDVVPEPREAMSTLAEGVIVELLYFLRRNERAGRPAVVTFVPVANLLGGRATAGSYTSTYAATVAHLADDQFGIRALLDRIDAEPHALPKVAYVAHDPLDAKYVHWLRPYGYARGMLPLVPTLALRLADLQLTKDRQDAAGLLLAARCRLLQLADEVWLLPSQDDARPPSYATQLATTLSTVNGLAVQDLSWRDVGIPKASDVNWALTARESAQTIRCAVPPGVTSLPIVYPAHKPEMAHV